MEDLREQFNHLTDLKPFPKIAESIGFYTAAFSNAELSLWQVYGIVLGVGGMEAMVLLGEFQSFSSKLKAVDRFFTQVRPDIPLNELIKHIFIEAKAVNTFRNKLAHGQYQTDEKKTKLYLHAYATDPVKSRTTPVTKDEVNFFELTDELMNNEITKAISLHRSCVAAMQLPISPLSSPRTS